MSEYTLGIGLGVRAARVAARCHIRGELVWSNRTRITETAAGQRNKESTIAALMLTGSLQTLSRKDLTAIRYS